MKRLPLPLKRRGLCGINPQVAVILARMLAEMTAFIARTH